MVKLVKKTDKYQDCSDKMLNLLRYNLIIRLVPTVLLALIGVLVCILVNSAIPLVIVFVALVYFLIITKIMSGKFDTYKHAIYEEYISYNKYQSSAIDALLVEDNKGFSSYIKSDNELKCWAIENKLYYISGSFLGINNLTINDITYEGFKLFLKKDFGRLVVPFEDVDHYRDTSLICKFEDSVLKLKFSDEKALDFYIPTKEYFYSSGKKEDIK